MNGKPFNLDGRYRMKFLLLSALILISTNAFSKKKGLKVQRIAYFNEMHGNIHQNASKYSNVLTTVSCGHPIKVYKEKKSPNGGLVENISYEWDFVKVGSYNGYVLSDFLGKRKQKCFQDKYPRFVEKFKLEPSEMYYWGRLYDQYVGGKSKVK
jgi:hypothetical protein